MLNLRIGRISQWFSPGYGHCLRCRTTWNVVKGHTTYYRDDKGLFALCEKCWRELTPEERVPYYRRLFLSWGLWEPLDEDVWAQIEKAVLSEE